MHLFEKNIKDLGLEIPEPPSAVANYVPYKIADNLVFISGQAPSKNGQIILFPPPVESNPGKAKIRRPRRDVGC